MPGSRDIAEVALAASVLTEAGTAGQSLNRHVVQAFALLTGVATKRGVQTVGYVADGVLHAYSVGTAGRKCKQEEEGLPQLFPSSTFGQLVTVRDRHCDLYIRCDSAEWRLTGATLQHSSASIAIS